MPSLAVAVASNNMITMSASAKIAATGMSECPRHPQPREIYQGELAFFIRLAKQRNVEKLDLLLFQFAKAGESSRLILSEESGNILFRVSYKWAIGYDWVSLGLSRI